MNPTFWAAMSLSLLVATCRVDAPGFVCHDDRACDPGTCEPTGFCSFLDDRCASGRRYGDASGPFAGDCVAFEPAAVVIRGPDDAQDFVFPSSPAGNRTTVALTVRNVALSVAHLGSLGTSALGLGAPFFFEGGTCASGGQLASGASCSLVVSFVPSDATRSQVSLSLAYENLRGAAVAKIALSGEGLPPATCADLRDDHGFDALGAGTPQIPYLLCHVDQLLDISGNPGAFAKHFLLGADLDLAAYDDDSFPPLRSIGDEATPFTGVFDGGGHSLNGARRMIFGRVQGANAVVKRLHLTDVDVHGDTPVGALIGYLDGGSVMDCSSTGQVGGTGRVGGLVGVLTQGVISSSWSSAATHSNTDVAGGLVGMAGDWARLVSAGFVLNSFATGEVSTVLGSGGGLIGGSTTGLRVFNSFATGDVLGGTGGGLVGFLFEFGLVRDSFAVGALRTDDDNGGGGSGRLIGGMDASAQVARSFSHAGAACTNAGTGAPCHGPVDGEVVLSNLDDFYDSSSEVFAAFDFSNVWRPEPSALPALAPAFFRLAAFGSCADHEAGTPFAFGAGTPESPFVICTREQLERLATSSTYAIGYAFQLRRDIDLAESNVFPIDALVGLFDGNGRRIDHLTIEGAARSPVGLFSRLDGVVRRLALTDVVIENGGNGGALAGELRGLASDVYVTGAISGASIGGVIGKVLMGGLERCYSTASLTAAGTAGGLVADSPWVSHSFAAAAITAASGGPIVGGGMADASYFDPSLACSGCDNSAGIPADASFFSPLHPPLDTWDFETVWSSDGVHYPTLR